MKKPSKYNIYFSHLNKKYIYNTLFNGLIEADIELFENLKENELNHISDTSIESLYDNNFIIDFGRDEYIELMNYRDKISTSPYNGSFTFYPTMECNFNCSYCVEKSANKIKTDVDYANKSTSFIKEYAINYNLKRIQTTWSGGEPLIKFDEIEKISKELITFCDENSIEYTSKIVTNGYLIDEKIISSLKKIKIKFIQITLDGPPDIHNKLRPLKNGKGTWKEVVESIIKASVFLPVLLRVNLDNETIKYFEKLINETSLLFQGNDNIIFSIKPITPGIDDSLIINKFPSPNDFAKIEKIAYNILKNNGLKFQETIDDTKILRCDMYSEHGYNIANDMNIYKCSGLVGHEEYSYGKIDKYGKIIDNNTRKTSFDIYDDFECKDCPILPHCMGKCTFEEHIALGSGSFGCSSLKYNIIDKVIAKYLQG